MKFEVCQSSLFKSSAIYGKEILSGTISPGQKREISRITRIRERFADDRWLRKENKKRRKRNWKTRNNFYK